ncbi:MAG: hypothetical protein IJ179_10405 [Oscillospiraceae bacterium]|nr:hypothetical protein [Oscillospiraceae bacterium]
MAERYTRIFSLDSLRYTRGAPLLITAGALLQDGYSGDLLCQLKLRSLSEQPVKAATVVINMLDIAGDPLPPEKSHQYLDLKLQRGEEFGRDTAIILPRRDARAFDVRLSEVIFEDNSRWLCRDDAQWLRIPPQRSLENAYGDEHLAEQFRIRYGPDCRDMPYADGGLWFCTCGAINTAGSGSCWHCRRVGAALLNVNEDSLRQEAAGRLKQEEVRLEEDKAENKKQRRKLLLAAGIILPLLILALGLLKTIPPYLQQKQAYENAATLLAMGRYEQAAQAFSQLGDYQDSAEQAEKNVPYQRALVLLDRAAVDDASALSMIGHTRADLSEDVTAATLLYQAALEEFQALDGYKDSVACAARCEAGLEQAQQALLQRDYEAAKRLLELKEYSQARQAFLALGDYSDSAEMAVEAVYRKACALYQFILNYDVRHFYADLSISSDRGSTFILPKEAALAQGSQCVTDLRDACGGDLSDIQLTDAPDSSGTSLAESVIALFQQLEGYGDSQACIDGILDATDYTKEFYVLCETGDIFGAYDWLTAYDGDFADREHWLSMLELYKPFCASWTLHGGDVTVIPLTVGRSQPCSDFSTRVLLSDGRATLRISANDGEDYFLDLYANQGETRFASYPDENTTYLLVITDAGHLSYMKYDSEGALKTSCEYLRG